MIDNVIAAGPELIKALKETFIMLVITISGAVLFGTPLGTLLYLTRPGSLVKAPKLYLVLNLVVNLVRSLPFLILLIAIIPFTRLIVGTAIGTIAVTVPMIISAVPYLARLIEQSLLEVNRGVVEMAEAAGSNMYRVIWSVLYSEARSGMANSITIITVNFLAYSTVAGLVGGGGLGDFALRYGYYRYETDLMFFTVFLIVVIVQIIQFTGNYVVKRLDRRL